MGTSAEDGHILVLEPEDGVPLSPAAGLAVATYSAHGCCDRGQALPRDCVVTFSLQVDYRINSHCAWPVVHSDSVK